MTPYIILIEDNKTIRDALIPALKDLAGMEVLAIADTADDGIAALERESGWRLAIVDLFLREGSGMEVLHAVQKRMPDQQVVVLSNYATPELRNRCMAIGADAVFDKSTGLDEFFQFCVDNFRLTDSEDSQ